MSLTAPRYTVVVSTPYSNVSVVCCDLLGAPVMSHCSPRHCPEIMTCPEGLEKIAAMLRYSTETLEYTPQEVALMVADHIEQ